MEWFGDFLDWCVKVVAVLSTGWLAGWALGAIFAVLVTFKEYIRDIIDKHRGS